MFLFKLKGRRMSIYWRGLLLRGLLVLMFSLAVNTELEYVKAEIGEDCISR